MTTAIAILLILAAGYALLRVPARQSIGSQLAGSVPFEDRDIARMTADLRAIDSRSEQPSATQTQATSPARLTPAGCQS